MRTCFWQRASLAICLVLLDIALGMGPAFTMGLSGKAAPAAESNREMRFPADANVVDVTKPPYGAVPDDGRDDTAAIQAALDAHPSGNHVFYFPDGVYELSETLRPARDDGVTKRNILQGQSRHGTVLKLRDNLDHGDAVVDYRAGPAQFFRNAVRNLTIDIGRGNPQASGLKFNASNQGAVWARQLDLEGNTQADPDIAAKIVNDGGRVWILGLKTEDEGTHIKTIGGGRTELLGALHVGAFGGEPRFVTIDSSFSAALIKGGRATVRETRDGETREGDIGQSDVYSAFPPASIADREVMIDNADSSGVTVRGPWTAAASFPGGYLDRDFLFTPPGSGRTVTFSTKLPKAGIWEVAVRWLDDRSGLSHAGHASNAAIAVRHAEGVSRHTVDQRRGGGRWVTLGRYRFVPEQQAGVVLDADRADGKVIADAVRFRAEAADETAW